MFTPKHPKTKPILENDEAEEEKYDFSELVDKAVHETRIYNIDAC